MRSAPRPPGAPVFERVGVVPASVVTSRAMKRLDAAIASTRNPADIPLLKAERALFLTRLGRFDQARDVLEELRAVQAQIASPLLAAWLCLNEGVLDHVSQHSATARDRILRAYALSVAARLRPMMALSSAWLAFLDYVDGDATSLARRVTETLQEAERDHHAARSRACLVAAQAYHWAGRLDLAQPLYQKARDHAQAEGDELTVAAMMLNRAVIDGNQLRVASIFGAGKGEADGQLLRQALLAAESSGNFNEYVGKAAAKALVPVLRAQLLLAQGDAAGALALYESHLGDLHAEGLDHIRPPIDADMSWCKLALGRTEEALAAALAIGDDFGPDCEEDASASAHGRLAQVFEALRMPEKAAAHLDAANACLKVYRDQQAEFVERLDAALKQVP